MRRAIFLGLAILLVGPRSATTTRAGAPLRGRADSLISGSAVAIGGPFEPDPDLDLPDNPTVEQQIAAGKHRLTRVQQEDQTLDRNHEFLSYIKEVVARLLAAQDAKPPYRINVHVSTAPVLNAYAALVVR